MTTAAPERRPLRIGAVLDSLGIGGVERGCLDLLRHLDPMRYQPFLWSFRPGALVGAAEEAGIPLRLGHDRPAEDAGWDERDRLAREAWTDRLAGELTEERIDLCLVYGWPEAVTAAQRGGVPAIVERTDGAQLATRVLDKGPCAAVVCESRHVRDVLRIQRRRLGLDPARLVVIPNGVDVERFRPRPGAVPGARAALGIPAEAFVVGTVARLAAQKNLGLLMDAFAGLARRTPGAADRAWLVLAGPDGGEQAALERRATDLGIAHRVRFPGPADEPERVLQALDVFAMTSWIEGSPFALLEAMAMGLPLIATPVGGIPEMLDDNAIVVDPLAPLATTRALVELYGDPARRAWLGERGRRRARALSLARMVGRYERLFSSLVPDPR